MAYYWVTQAQLYLQGLGFGSELRPINRESQDIRANQLGIDNSYSWDKHDILRFGKGGVDDAEDAEVILHEYGHAVQDSQQTPFGFGFTPEAGAIGEGFADYFAGTVSAHVSPTPDPECIADWDSVSYDPTAPHCLRRLDAGLHYPENLNLERSTAPAGSGRRRCGRSGRRSARRSPTGSSSRPGSTTARARRCRRPRPRRSRSRRISTARHRRGRRAEVRRPRARLARDRVIRRRRRSQHRGGDGAVDDVVGELRQQRQGADARDAAADQAEVERRDREAGRGPARRRSAGGGSRRGRRPRPSESASVHGRGGERRAASVRSSRGSRIEPAARVASSGSRPVRSAWTRGGQSARHAPPRRRRRDRRGACRRSVRSVHTRPKRIQDQGLSLAHVRGGRVGWVEGVTIRPRAWPEPGAREDLDAPTAAEGARRTGPTRFGRPCAGCSRRRRHGRDDRLPPRAGSGYQPRVSSSCSGASVAVEIPTIGSPRPAETSASTFGSA